MRRHAFTLIEVLLAVFIIGLGSIGLFALFAGVATEQVRASELTKGVAKAQGLAGVLRGKVGPVGEWVSGGFSVPDPVFGQPLARGVWYPSFYAFAGPSDRSYSLTVNPRSGNNIRGGRFFVPDAIEVELYTNKPVYSGSAYGPQYTSGVMGIGTMLNGSGVFGGQELRRLPHYRAALGSVEIEFWKADVLTGQEVMAFHATDAVLTPSVSDDVLQNSLSFYLPSGLPDGSPPPPEPRVLFNYAEYSPSPDSATAGVDGFDISSLIASDEWITSIRVRYAHREDRLLSLSDRVAYEADDSRQSGRRASAGATVLYRVAPSGRSQFITITYTVDPLGREGAFVPPEFAAVTGPQATTGLLRITSGYDLGYDVERSSYYLLWDESTPDDALEVGDILVVGGELDPTVSTPINQRGADTPLRVVRVLEVTPESGSPEVRAYLNDAPRYKGRSMLIDLSSVTPLSRVYSLKRQVVSALDNSEWRIRPVVFQLLDVQ